MKIKVGDALFKGMQGCSSHDCVIDPPGLEEMGTNSMCHCIQDMSTSDFRKLQMRIKQISRYYIDTGETG